MRHMEVLEGRRLFVVNHDSPLPGMLSIFGDSASDTIVLSVRPDGNGNNLPDVSFTANGGAAIPCDTMVFDGVAYPVQMIQMSGGQGDDNITVDLRSH